MHFLKFIKNFYFPKDVQDHLRVKITVGRIFVTFFLIAVTLLAWIFVPLPVASVKASNIPYALNQKVAIDFSRPVKRNEVSFTLNPEVEGSWSWEKPFWGSKHLFTRLVFTPSMYQPDSDYNVKVSNIKGMASLKKSSNQFDYKFKSQSIPKILKALPADKAVDIKIDDAFHVYLDQKNTELAEFSFEFKPKIDFETSYNEEQSKFVLKPKAPLAQGTSYKLIVFRTILISDTNDKKVIKRSNQEKMYETLFTTQNAPEISSISPSGDHVLTTTPNLKISFSQDMDQASVEANFETNPKIEGGFEWESSKVLNYRVTKTLSYGTAYNIKIKAGTKNKQSGFLPNDINSSFITIGNVVASISPTNGAGGVKSNANISVYFDQAVDHASAQSHFSFSDGRAGSFSWSGNTMIFNPNEDFAKSASYTATISTGVKSISGLDSNRAFSSTFYTEQNVVKLNVPLDYQDFALSCEVAALKMALRYRGINVSESELMSWIGYDPTPHIGNTWGDPYTAFVGSITGKQNTTGYGVYWDPIAKSANHYRGAQAFTGWSVAQLATELEKGNPVVIWGVYPGGYYDPWTTPGGKFINAWKGEHARTAIGFVGPASNPSQIIINDPVAGTLYWSTAKFLSDWGTFGNAGVVIY